jgi:hypothetical protein
LQKCPLISAVVRAAQFKREAKKWWKRAGIWRDGVNLAAVVAAADGLPLQLVNSSRYRCAMVLFIVRVLKFQLQGTPDCETGCASKSFSIYSAIETLSRIEDHCGKDGLDDYQAAHLASCLGYGLQEHAEVQEVKHVAQRLLLKFLLSENVAGNIGLEVDTWKRGASLVADLVKLISTGKISELRLPFAAMPLSAMQDIFEAARTPACPLRRVGHSACDATAAILARFVRSSTSLTYLDLSGNAFSDQAWCILANAIRACASLGTVLLKRCTLSIENLRIIEDVVRPRLTIDVRDQFDDDDCDDLDSNGEDEAEREHMASDDARDPVHIPTAAKTTTEEVDDGALGPVRAVPKRSLGEGLPCCQL